MDLVLAILLLLFAFGQLLNYYIREKPRQEAEKERLIQEKQSLINRLVFDKSLYVYSHTPVVTLPKNAKHLSPSVLIKDYLEYWAYELYTKRNERSVFGFTDNKGRVFFEYVIVGNPESVRASLEEVVGIAKSVNASGVLSLHNHFSRKEHGPNLIPSEADILFSLKLIGWCYHNGLKFEGTYITSRGHLQEYIYDFFEKAGMEVPDPMGDVIDYGCHEVALAEELGMAISGTLAAFRNAVSELEELGVWNGPLVMRESRLHNQSIVFTLIDDDYVSDESLFFVNIVFEENFTKESLKAYLSHQLPLIKEQLNKVPEYFKVLTIYDVQDGTGISRVIIDQVRFIGLAALACSGKADAEKVERFVDHLRLLENQLTGNGLGQLLSEPIPEHQSSVLQRRLDEVGLGYLLEVAASSR